MVTIQLARLPALTEKKLDLPVSLVVASVVVGALITTFIGIGRILLLVLTSLCRYRLTSPPVVRTLLP